ncbi:xanthine dehydrogenase family protein molybdopterin-binding subunit [Rhodoplanes sp. TEM]|uniref:Xanthine dehydrogenase family protein molybdopterin-binding subunit n=1 Tax=Rhodoplanes tepidamans TaxID=200616 RepID=A0ABT5J9W2_RHOTP|nr:MULTISPECIES: xanthine dehydrogenase family protein molybdopterin-binding subunit [Rhodoplanes]MDC7786201.1 xanthine dehydrogenase family protein molybdopterin-binding subunit [Rhodoplanes tepidamans]MDC7982428.1 xanthine dehydrogenase family protein molybdopterin-binding subunit [Rhodoplanes sp. TEM]MDQ0355000.1 carbon-monoxide dehydrogenase large subunit [Rhodoplanes tepidamans]
MGATRVASSDTGSGEKHEKAPPMDDTTASAAAFRYRVEDAPLLRGAGRFMADVPLPGQACGVFVRSPHAHAVVTGIDSTAALAVPGVLAVLTAADMAEAGVGSIAFHAPMRGANGALAMPFRPALAETVMHAGEPVALVVAETALAAQDAADLVEVSYAERTPVVDVQRAVRADAPQLWPEAPGNLALDWHFPTAAEGGDPAAVDAAIAGAVHVARVSHVNQRIMVASMEPRGATASYDAATGSYALRVCSQGAIAIRDHMARILGVDTAKVRVTTDDVGGAFGMKSSPYPEYPALCVAARRTGRPVHWMSTRSEAFLTDAHARDSILEGELAVDRRGRFLALRLRTLVNLGAYVGQVGAFLATVNFARCVPGMYLIPKVDMAVRCVFTNTTPTAPYRGAGRPEANYLIERLVDEAARLTGIAPDEIRRRNLVPAGQIPWRTPVGTVYDSGDFPAVFETAVALADVAGVKARKREAKRNGRLRGLGLSCMVEHAGGVPTEGAGLFFPGDGTVVLALGAHATGQGHATVFPRVLSERLGVPLETIRFVEGDSGNEVISNSTVASRTTSAAGAAIVKAVAVVLEKGRRLAADALETAEADIVYEGGVFTIAGTDRRISLFEVADAAKRRKAAGEVAEDLDTRVVTDTPQTFPNGCHVAEVEIDPETGGLTLVRYTAVDDCGVVLDHTLVEGQLHGALAQGLGQAVMERAVYDLDSGQLVTGSFQDYAMPRAADMPPVVSAEENTPATTNPLGVKGVGEAGTTGSLAAVMNAIADAIPTPAGIRMDMPATPEKIWAACKSLAEFKK